MKFIFLTVVLTGCAITSFSQANYTELGVHGNGLIYDDTTITRLKFIVDSLHIRYRNCDLNRNYYSFAQTRGHYVSMDTGDVKAALRDIQNNISVDNFVKKYPLALVDSNVLIIKTDEKESNRKWMVYNNATAPYGSLEVSFDADSADKIREDDYDISGKNISWVYKYKKPQSYRKEVVEAFFVAAPFKTVLLPEKYAALILYSDCMIDTLASTFLDSAQYDRQFDKAKCGPKFEAFLKYLTRKTKFNADESFFFWIDSATSAYIEKYLPVSPECKKMFVDAVEEALQLKFITCDWFEYYTGKYYSKKAELTLMRNRMVAGACSMDQSPRVHVFNIAQLAAETANWQVFLRAHLDIMNDQVPRAIDASYAKRNRKTYIKELEELNINVHDLMLATCFRISNSAPNHYYGDIGRLGRAMAEAKDRPLLEQKILSMITDNELDDYNRLGMHCLFLNYLYYLDKKEERAAGIKKLLAAGNQLPPYLISKIQFDKNVIEEGAGD